MVFGTSLSRDRMTAVRGACAPTQQQRTPYICFGLRVAMPGDARGLATGFVSDGWPRHTIPINVLQVALVFCSGRLQARDAPCRGVSSKLSSELTKVDLASRVSSVSIAASQVRMLAAQSTHKLGCHFAAPFQNNLVVWARARGGCCSWSSK